MKLLQNEDRAVSTDSLQSSTLSLVSLKSVDEFDIQTSDADNKRLVTLDLYILQGKKGYSLFNHHLSVLLEDTYMVNSAQTVVVIHGFIFVHDSVRCRLFINQVANTGRRTNTSSGLINLIHSLWLCMIVLF